MKDVRILAAVVVIGLGGAVRADVAPEKKSTLTITTPLEVPGAVLEPGTYVVKLVDTQNNRNVVTFMSADEKKVFATSIATPHVAAEDPRNSTFVFYASPEGSTKVLRTWFAPNDRYGQDFVYPAERAAALRQTTNTEVPAMAAEQSREIADGMKPAAVVSDNEPLRPAPASAADSEYVAPASMTADATTALPQTASRTPLLLAAGLLALGVASALRFAGRA